MKRVLLLPILAMGLMVSQAWGQVTEGAEGNCMYSGKQISCAIGGGCFNYSTQYSGVGENNATCGPGNTTTPKCTCQQLFDGCQAAGQAYTDVNQSAINPSNEYGKGVSCASNGGVPIAGGATKCGTCQYPGNATCNAVWSGGPYSKGETCEIAMATCTADNGTPGCTEGSANPNPPTQFCNYGPCVLDPSNPNGCLDGGCYALTSTGCEFGTIVSSCPACNLPPGNRPAGTNCDGNGNGNGNGQEPIIISGRSVGLTVVPNGNMLHIISERNATVELFSMTGAKVFSSKVAAGNSSLSLGKQKTGVYYAVVRSGAQKQTVKVVLK